jgi:hypothetical protein
MHVCPRENFNKDTVFITTLSGHGCFISQNDIRWVCFNDDNDHTRIWLTKDSPLVNLLGAEEIQTDDKVTFSLFYLGYDITEEIECSDQ